MPLKKRAVKTAGNNAAGKKKLVKGGRVVKRAPRAAPKPELSGPPAPGAELKVEASKYYAGPVIQKFSQEARWEFPAGYGDNRIVLMVRDPRWIYAYWEISDQRRSEISQQLGEGVFARARLVLRVYEAASLKHHDVEVGGARNWYIRVPAPNRTYFAEIGYLTEDGRFIAAARSNSVTTPLETMSDVIDEQWMIPDWERMYALSGGFGLGRGSQEIKELMKKRFQQESASGWLFSPSSPSRRPGERPFWLAANCELIVYGATEPSATVTVQGRKIKLRDDGTFSLRFSLPDGRQVIPIEAIRDDGAERRKITPRVERNTE
ncbi:MAG: DUF4912 domain-containing protein [Candidatus Saganbacteria bacterium]|nr:DUF4912 domain-containing protein [Candidatus Saganbacteria bacterium]